jgi:dTDP-glucose 4,6-dehydratase
LITGGAGFVGSVLVRLAIKRGYRVVNIDGLKYSSCLENLKEVSSNERYEFEIADIRDRSSLSQIFSKYEPDAVIHLAAESHVDRSISGSQIFMETNFMGTFNLLEAARIYWEGVGRPEEFRFHHVSTDEVFGSLPSNTEIKFKECTPYNPRSPYSSSKAGSNHLVNAWYETYNLPTVVTNCSNNYGPNQFPEKLIPVIIINAIANKRFPIYGDGKQIRDWIYVEDHAKALLLVMERGIPGRNYNIGGDNERTNLNLVKEICDILQILRPPALGSYFDLVKFVDDRPGHDRRYAIDYSRIQKELGWYPSINFKKGLVSTVRWYLENENWWRPLINKSVLY